MEPVTTVILAHGHKNVQATHKTTFEITKEPTLTRRGDCIIAVEATKGLADLSPEFKEAARKKDAQITITIKAGKAMETVKGRGSPRLLFAHPTDLVIRKSEYVCSRTLAIKADKAANDLSRRLLEKMKDPSQRIRITLAVESY